MASSPPIQDQADADPALTLVGTTGPWHTVYQGQTIITTWKIYLVHDSSLVTPLTETPDVLTGVGAAQASWLPVSQRWYADPVVVVTAVGGRWPGVVDQSPQGRRPGAAPRTLLRP